MNRTSTCQRYQGSNDLNCYIHDGAACLRFEIEGNLSGQAAVRLEQSWCTASSVIGSRQLVITVGDLSNVDAFGRRLLLKWQEYGAHFVAKSPLAAALVGSIIGQPVLCEERDRGEGKWPRFRLRALPLIPLIVVLLPAALNAASLAPATSRAWEEYVEAATLRMDQRLRPGKAYLWIDEVPGRLGPLRSGEIIVSPFGPQNPKRVPSGLIHDWIGTAFIPHAKLIDVLQVVRHYGRYKEMYQPSVKIPKRSKSANRKITLRCGSSTSHSL
jgi:hypothetical protein